MMTICNIQFLHLLLKQSTHLLTVLFTQTPDSMSHLVISTCVDHRQLVQHYSTHQLVYLHTVFIEQVHWTTVTTLDIHELSSLVFSMFPSGLMFPDLVVLVISYEGLSYDPVLGPVIQSLGINITHSVIFLDQPTFLDKVFYVQSALLISRRVIFSYFGRQVYFWSLYSSETVGVFFHELSGQFWFHFFWVVRYAFYQFWVGTVPLERSQFYHFYVLLTVLISLLTIFILNRFFFHKFNLLRQQIYYILENLIYFITFCLYLYQRYIK